MWPSRLRHLADIEEIVGSNPTVPTGDKMAVYYEVGGAIRDELLGIPLDEIKDIDFAVEAESYEDMKDDLLKKGVEIFLETPDYFTIRGRIPSDSTEWRCPGKAVDFVLCRKEHGYSDGRRPDEVYVGSIYDDLQRRDFTVNSCARGSDGTILDPHGGQIDLKQNLLRCVGSAEDRFKEDALRALRAIRFAITKGFTVDLEIHAAFRSSWLPELMKNISGDRKRDELMRCFKFSNVETIYVLSELTPILLESIFYPNGPWLMPSLTQP